MTGSPTSGKTKTKDKINILRDNVLDDRGLNVMLKIKIRLRTKATIFDRHLKRIDRFSFLFRKKKIQ